MLSKSSIYVGIPLLFVVLAGIWCLDDAQSQQSWKDIRTRINVGEVGDASVVGLDYRVLDGRNTRETARLGTGCSEDELSGVGMRNMPSGHKVNDDKIQVDWRLALSGFAQANTDIGNIFHSRRLLNADNNASKNESKKNAVLSTAEKISFTVAYAFCIIIGLTGNIIILIAIKTSKELHNDLNYLLCHLAIADMLHLVTTVVYELFVIHKIGNGRDFIPAYPGVAGDFLCKTMWCLPRLFLYVFVFTLVSMTLERFVAVVFPFRIGIFKGKNKWIIAGIWTASVVLSLPVLYATKSIRYGSDNYCDTDFTPFSSNTYNSQVNAYKKTVNANLYVAYVIPFLLIFFLNGVMAYRISTRHSGTLSQAHLTRSSSSPSSREIVTMLATVSLVYAFTSLPNQVYGFSYVYNYSWVHKSLPVYFTFLLLFIAELSSVVNPWLYPLFVKRFRKKYAKMLGIIYRSHNKGLESNDTSTKSTQRNHLTENMSTGETAI